MIKQSLAVVLIPGFMLDQSLWDDFVQELPSEWQLIRANLSHGNSIPEIAQYMIRSLPPKCILIGFSLGGYVARSIAEQFPEQVSALILIASSLRSDTAQQRQQKMMVIKLSSKETFKGLSSTAIRQTLHPSNNHNDRLIHKIQKMGQHLGYDTFVRQSLLNRNEQDTTKILCPTLIIYSEQDQIRSADEANELHQQIKGSDLAVIENTGHMIPLEQPKALAQVVLKWLNRDYISSQFEK